MYLLMLSSFVQACEVLEAEIAKATESLKEAEARRAALQLSERSRADAEEVRRKEDIDQLQVRCGSRRLPPPVVVRVHVCSGM